MTTHDDLFERLSRAADDVPVAPGSVEAVEDRGRQRRTRRRATLAGGGLVVGLAVLAGLGSLTTADLRPTPVPVIDQPGDERPTDERASDEPTPSTITGRQGAPIRSDRLPWEVVRFGDVGIVRGDQVLQEGDRRVVRALPLGDGRVVNQLAGPPDGSWTGELRVASADGPGGVELATTGEFVRLLTYREAYGEVWWSGRVPATEGTDEHLFTYDVDTGETRDAGFSTGVESFTDDLAFDRDGERVAWLGCHMQCTLWVGTLDDLFDPTTDAATRIASGWLAGLDISPDGGWVASVVEADPNVDGGDSSPSELVVWDLAGTEVARVVLPRGLAYDAARVEFSPDGASVLVGDADGTWFVEGVEGGNPARPVEGPEGQRDFGAAMTGEPGTSADAPNGGEASVLREGPDWHDDAGHSSWYAGVVWPYPGRTAWQWTITEGPEYDGIGATEPFQVVHSLLDFLQVGVGEARRMSRGEERQQGDWSTLEVEVAAGDRSPGLLVTLRQVHPTDFWWVDRVDALDDPGGNPLYDSYTRRGDAIELYGGIPEGAERVDVVVLDQVRRAVQVRELATEGEGRWAYRAELPSSFRNAPIAFAMRAFDDQGRVVQLSVLPIGAGDGAAS